MTDASGCVIMSNPITIIQPSPATVVGTVTDVACFGENSGAIDLDVTGGQPPYLFNWNPGGSHY